MDDLCKKELRYQRARDYIGDLISNRSAWMYEEQQKPDPDLAQIEKWDEEASALYHGRKHLQFEDDQIEAALARYHDLVVLETAIFLARIETRNSQMDREAVNERGPLPDEVDKAIYLKYERKVLGCVEPIKAGDERVAVFFAVQPGFGRGVLSRILGAELAEKNTVTIDVDELRELHPKYKEWRADPTTAEYAWIRTVDSARDWGDQLMGSAIYNNLNIIVDATFSNPGSVKAQIEALKKEGYKIAFKGLAIQRGVSELGYYSRFEEGAATYNALLVPPEARDYAYAALAQTLDLIEQNQAAYDARVQVYDRKGDQLYDNWERSLDGA